MQDALTALRRLLLHPAPPPPCLRCAHSSGQVQSDCSESIKEVGLDTVLMKCGLLSHQGCYQGCYQPTVTPDPTSPKAFLPLTPC